MKRFITTIASATVALTATVAQAELSPEQMSLLEEISKACGKNMEMLGNHGYDTLTVESQFLSSARKDGASNHQLELLRTYWSLGESIGVGRTYDGEVTDAQANTLIDQCSNIGG